MASGVLKRRKVIIDTDTCVLALSRALEATDPELYDAINDHLLLLIASFLSLCKIALPPPFSLPPFSFKLKECLGLLRRFAVGFNTGGGLGKYTITDHGKTATKRLNGFPRLVCISPKFHSGNVLCPVSAIWSFRHFCLVF